MSGIKFSLLLLKDVLSLTHHDIPFYCSLLHKNKLAAPHFVKDVWCLYFWFVVSIGCVAETSYAPTCGLAERAYWYNSK